MSQFAYTHINVLATVDIIPISKVLADENGIFRLIQFSLLSSLLQILIPKNSSKSFKIQEIFLTLSARSHKKQALKRFSRLRLVIKSKG
jgi:hypothetical protein